MCPFSHHPVFKTKSVPYNNKGIHPSKKKMKLLSLSLLFAVAALLPACKGFFLPPPDCPKSCITTCTPVPQPLAAGFDVAKFARDKKCTFRTFLFTATRTCEECYGTKLLTGRK